MFFGLLQQSHWRAWTGRFAVGSVYIHDCRWDSPEAYMHAYTRYFFVQIHIPSYMNKHVHMYIFISTSVFTHIHIYIYICTYIFMIMYVCMYVSIDVSITCTRPETDLFPAARGQRSSGRGSEEGGPLKPASRSRLFQTTAASYRPYHCLLCLTTVALGNTIAYYLGQMVAEGFLLQACWLSSLQCAYILAPEQESSWA